jgi:DNA-binding response OmpR family regulator
MTPKSPFANGAERAIRALRSPGSLFDWTRFQGVAMAEAAGRARVLVVEDGLLLAEVLCDALMDRGYIPIGPVPTVEAGLRSIDTCTVDAAVVDIRLRHGTSFPLCAVLRERRIPFVILTGSSAQEVPAALADAPLLKKPCGTPEILDALDAVLGVCRPSSCFSSARK